MGIVRKLGAGSLLALVALTAGAARAVVSDRFVCETTLTDQKAGQTGTSKQELVGVRMPVQGQSSDHSQVTLGELRFELGVRSRDGRLESAIYIVYQHAMRDLAGKPDARQTNCMMVGSKFCPDGSGLDCKIDFSQSRCTMGPPFDPVNGWQSVAVSDRGVPLFDQRAQVAQTVELTDDQGAPRGSINVNCQYRGTVE